MDNKTILRRGAFTIAALFVGLIGGGLVNSYRSNRPVQVQLAQGVQAQIFKELGGTQTYNYNAKKPLYTLQTTTTVKLKTGTYDFVADNSSKHYASPVTKITITQTTTSVNIDPTLSAATLSSMLSGQLPAIHTALLAAYPSLPQFYSFAHENLYQHGDWYGAVLQPNSSSSTDTLKIIMQLKNNAWVVAAKPAISIGIPAHPNVPSTVVSAVDAL